MRTEQAIDVARRLFAARRVYLNTASVGLPPSPSLEAMARSLDELRDGLAEPEAYDESVDRSRAAFAALAGVDLERVAIASQVSVGSGLVASSLTAGDEVLCAEEDFASVLYPFLAVRSRGVTVRSVPLDALLDEIRPSTTWIAVSAAQSADGRLIDLEALAREATRVGARTFVDLTQAAGWLPLRAGLFDVTATGAYKWLCCPRGTGFLTVGPSAGAILAPVNAGWYAAADRWSALYGPDLRLAPDARRYDVSPAWLGWVGATPALELLAQVGVEAIHEHNTGLARSFGEALGLPFRGSAIVSLAREGAVEALRASGIAAAGRAGAARLAFHLYNDETDVAAALRALGAA
jgi:selenocysteine lyase/cysteine desulfurase